MSEVFLDVFIVVGGLYLVFTAIHMKKTGVITTTLISKGADLAQAKDKDGFIQAMYGKTLLIGALTALVGVVDILNTEYFGIPYFNMAMCLIFFIIIMIYAKFNLDAQKQ